MSPASLRLPLLQPYKKPVNGVVVMGENVGGEETGRGRRKRMGGGNEG
jgi:hypothetical protein